MITAVHFLRPWWFLTLIPLLGLMVFLHYQKPQLRAWSEVCDAHLLPYLLHNRARSHRALSVISLFFSMFFLILSLSGPSWQQLPVPVYQAVQPRVVLLDMSEEMMRTDLTPNRLSRAKFKIHDLLARKDIGQFALIAYTGEPFVVSPLTDDGQTIASLLTELTPDVIPVGGQKLNVALDEAAHLIHQSGYQHGQILVLSASTPSSDAISTAKRLAAEGIYSSIIPMNNNQQLNPLFQRFAHAGKGQSLVYSSDITDLNTWIEHTRTQEFAASKDNDVPLWRDDGRWFLLPALLFFLPIFQRGWLQRMMS